MEKETIEFVNGYTENPQEKRRLDRLARTHAARIGSLRSLHKRSASQGNTQSINRSLTHHPNGPGCRDIGATILTPAPQQQDDENNADRMMVPGRTLNPVLGPTQIGDIATQDGIASCEAMVYYLQYISPNIMSFVAGRNRLELSHQHSVMKHGILYAAALHRCVVRGHAPPCERQMMLHQKAETLRLLQEEVNHLSRGNLELVLLVIIHLIREELDSGAVVPPDSTILLFNPHIPTSCWMNVYGRTKTVAAHARALVRLVQYGGGIDKMAPDVVRSLRVTDLHFASTACVPPAFPNVRTFEKGADEVLWAKVARECPCPGRGFANTIPGKLPIEALSVFQTLVLVERMLSWYAEPNANDPEYHLVIKARNRTHHYLLSLPEDLSDSTNCPQVVYDICRVTALLYSTAVLFPLPARGWHLNYLSDLRYSLDMPMLWLLPQYTELLVWSLYTACLAAMHTIYRNFFLNALRTVLTSSGLVLWSDVEVTLLRFLWSEKSCGPGGRIVWDMLDMEQCARFPAE
ncbi:hypothetical protein LTR17_007767 [Elasticomyces elasticus]|nr:hypothetical protein LTR17_007767 [Elasticomyces elasticus]